MQADRPSEKKRWEEVVWRKQSYNDRTVLKSGSFLNCFCPHCGTSLMRNNVVHLETVTVDGQEGWMELSPYLNAFERHSDIHLPEQTEVLDLKCCTCGHTLRVEGRRCGFEDSGVACVLVGISNVRVPFFFCMREGCHWHCIDPDDEHKIILDESMEW